MRPAFASAIARQPSDRLRVEAREYAERVESDEQFGDRARDLLSRLR